MNGFAYKPCMADVVDRLRSLYERGAPDRIFAVMTVPLPTLADFQRQYPAGYCAYPSPSERIMFWDRLLAERAAVEDDSIPSAYLSEMDQGLYGGLLGGDVQFMADPNSGWISSMVAPILEDWSQFDALRLDRSHPWFQRYLAQLELFTREASGKFGISHFILINGLNFVFELVGATRTYLSVAERPEMVVRALELAHDVNLAVQRAFFDRVAAVLGGTCSNMVQWIPGRILSESVDPFHMTSVAYFERWGRGPVERILSEFDGGVIHIHGNGRHLIEAVSTLRGLKAVFLGDDRGFPSAFDILDRLRAGAGDLPLVVQVDYPRFVEHLTSRRLLGGLLYKVSGVPDIGAANRTMEKVRAYRT